MFHIKTKLKDIKGIGGDKKAGMLITDYR